jgi:hypothetical protein
MAPRTGKRKAFALVLPHPGSTVHAEATVRDLASIILLGIVWSGW